MDVQVQRALRPSRLHVQRQPSQRETSPADRGFAEEPPGPKGDGCRIGQRQIEHHAQGQKGHHISPLNDEAPKERKQ